MTAPLADAGPMNGAASINTVASHIHACNNLYFPHSAIEPTHSRAKRGSGERARMTMTVGPGQSLGLHVWLSDALSRMADGAKRRHVADEVYASLHI
jgi:hypothetical protein